MRKIKFISLIIGVLVISSCLMLATGTARVDIENNRSSCIYVHIISASGEQNIHITNSGDNDSYFVEPGSPVKIYDSNNNYLRTYSAPSNVGGIKSISVN